MSVLTVDQGQCLMDVAIQHGGDARALIDIALMNDVSATDEFAPGTKLLVPDVPYNAQLISYLAKKKAVPATNNDYNIYLNKAGIGYWRIGVDFIVQ